MPIFAVHYRYSAEPEELAAVRPEHRAWLAGLYEQGHLLASGPLTDQPGALLVFRAENLEKVAEILDKDPFDLVGFIGERDIVEWNVVLGPWGQA